MKQELFYAMSLTRLTNFNFQQALELYKAVGSAQQIYEHRNDIGDIVESCSPRLIEALKDWSEAMKRAEFELKFMEEHRWMTTIPSASVNVPMHPLSFTSGAIPTSTVRRSSASWAPVSVRSMAKT